MNGLIYIHSAQKGFKLKVLAQNPKVSFNVIKDIQLLPADHPEDCSVAYSSVVGFGRVRMVDDPVEKLAAQIGFIRAGEIHGWDRIPQISHSIL